MDASLHGCDVNSCGLPHSGRGGAGATDVGVLRGSNFLALLRGCAGKHARAKFACQDGKFGERADCRCFQARAKSVNRPERDAKCSRAGCGQPPVWLLEWRNPRIHAGGRVKSWAACNPHLEYLRSWLADRAFLLAITEFEVSTQSSGRLPAEVTLDD